MANNKVVLGNETLIDLTEDTATAESVLDGYTFHGADGVQRVGTAIAGGGDDKMDIDGANADSAVTFADSAFTIGSRTSSYDLDEVLNFTNLSKSSRLGSAVSDLEEFIVYNNKIYRFYGVNCYSYDGLNNVTESTNLPINLGSRQTFIQWVSSVVYNNEIHLFGIYNYKPNSYYNYYYILEIVGNGTTWVRNNSFSSNQYSNANSSKIACVVYNNKIYMIGVSTFMSYDGNSWTNVGVSLPSNNFYNFSAVVYDNYIYILGSDSDSVNRYVYKWSESSGWIQSTDYPVNLKGRHKAIVYDDLLHVIGNDNTSYNKSYYIWDGEQWSQDTSLNDLLTGSATIYGSMIYDNHITTLISDRLFVYVKNQGTWFKNQNLPSDFMGTNNAVIYNNKIHIMDDYGVLWRSMDNTYTYWTEVSKISDFITGFISNSSSDDSYSPGMVVYNNKIHYFYNDSSSIGKHYSWDGTSWIEESTVPYNNYNSRVVVYDNKIHMLGGQAYPTNHYFWNGNRWYRASTLPYDFYNGGAIVCNNKIHIMGGGIRNTAWTVSDTNGYSHYSWNGLNWTKEIDLPVYLCKMGLVVYNNKIYIFGGQYKERTNESSYYHSYNIYVYTIGIGWSISNYELPTSIFNESAIVYNNKIYLFGDGDSSDSIYKFGIYCIESETDIVEIQNIKPKTFVLGDDCIVDGSYSTAEGENLTNVGNFSHIKGMNGKCVNDLSNIFSGSSNKFVDVFGVANQIAFGFSMFNNIIRGSMTPNNPLDGEYGIYGTVIGSYPVYIKIAPFGLYVLVVHYIQELSTTNAGGIYSVFISGNNKRVVLTEITATSTVVSLDSVTGTPDVLFSIRTTGGKGYQFTLIRLA